MTPVNARLQSQVRSPQPGESPETGSRSEEEENNIKGRFVG